MPFGAHKSVSTRLSGTKRPLSDSQGLRRKSYIVRHNHLLKIRHYTAKGEEFGLIDRDMLFMCVYLFS